MNGLIRIYLVTGLSLISIVSARGETHGGEILEIGGNAVKVFDEVEYAEPFLPDQAGKPWNRVETQLKYLKAKLPLTGKYLEDFFHDGTIVWWLVGVKLKTIDDSGQSHLLVTFRKEQIAANSGNTVQIRKDLWSLLDDESKATLLMHEMLWSAVSGHVKDGASVRQLSRYLLHPSFQNFTAYNVMSYLTGIITDENCPLKWWIKSDKENLARIQSFVVQKTPTKINGDSVIAVIDPTSSVKGLQLTPIRPNLSFENDAINYLRGGEMKLASDSRILPEELCGTLDYAGHRDWRLPSAAELDELYRIHFRQLPAFWARRIFPADRETEQRVSDSGYVKIDYSYSMKITYLDNSGRLHCFDNDSACPAEIYDVPYFCVRGM
jgi:hypothetical protein